MEEQKGVSVRLFSSENSCYSCFRFRFGFIMERGESLFYFLFFLRCFIFAHFKLLGLTMLCFYLFYSVILKTLRPSELSDLILKISSVWIMALL